MLCFRNERPIRATTDAPRRPLINGGTLRKPRNHVYKCAAAVDADAAVAAASGLPLGLEKKRLAPTIKRRYDVNTHSVVSNSTQSPPTMNTRNRIAIWNSNKHQNSIMSHTIRKFQRCDFQTIKNLFYIHKQIIYLDMAGPGTILKLFSAICAWT